MKSIHPRVSTSEVARRSSDPRHVVLDVRPTAAYNGWRLRQEDRGGHIPGARSLPLSWTQYMDWPVALGEKRITNDVPITVYGYDAAEADNMAERLTSMGFEGVSVYDRFLEEWAAVAQRPLSRLARYRQLVHPEWLHSLIQGGSPDEYDGNQFVLCHSHFDHYEDYLEGHIPTAVALNTLALESEETWNRRSPEELRAALRSLGIRHDTTVIVYGRFSFPRMDDPHPGKQAGHLGAIRCAAIMLYAGVEDVRILDGGITAWETSGYPLSMEATSPEPADDFGADIPANPQFFIDTPEAKELIASDDGNLVSIRSWEEFIGNTSGYHYIEAKGRIPGAVFGNCGSDAYHMENYENLDFTLREYDEIAAGWAEAGIVPEKRNAFYCGTGWRGSEAFMLAYLMGWPRAAIYDGGWFEWSADPENPVETGIPDAEAIERR